MIIAVLFHHWPSHCFGACLTRPTPTSATRLLLSLQGSYSTRNLHLDALFPYVMLLLYPFFTFLPYVTLSFPYFISLFSCSFYFTLSMLLYHCLFKSKFSIKQKLRDLYSNNLHVRELFANFYHIN